MTSSSYTSPQSCSTGLELGPTHQLNYSLAQFDSARIATGGALLFPTQLLERRDDRGQAHAPNRVVSLLLTRSTQKIQWLQTGWF